MLPSVSTPVRSRGRAATESAILRSAWTLWSGCGPDGLPLREVTAGAGCSHTLVARYFGSKQGLVEAVAALVATRVDRAVRDAWSTDGDPLEHLLATAREDPVCTRLVVRCGLGDLPSTALLPAFHLEQLSGLVGARPGAAGRRRLLLAYGAASMLLGWLTFEDFLVAATEAGRVPPGNGIPVTSLLSPAPTFEVLVDVAAPTAPTVTATAAVVNTNDVDPTSPAKSATATTRVAAAGAPQFSVSLSTGAFSVADRPVLQGGFVYDIKPNGRLDGITGCATGMDYQPPILLVPVVGPTLVPPQYSDNTLCINVSRVPLTNQWVGTSSVAFVAGPVFIPGVPLDFPVLQPRPVSAPAATISAPVLNGDGTLSGSATGANPELALNGGATYQVQWNLGQVPGVTCVDTSLCP